jgi:multicomponent Na+:H+ antiporter subunit D
MTYLVPLPVALSFTVAAFLATLHERLPRRVREALAIITSAAVAVVCGLLLAQALQGPIVYWFGGWLPRGDVALGICFAIDPLGAGLALLVAVLTTASLVFSWRYFDDSRALYEVLMLAFLGAMTGFCHTGDLFNLFVFFELMSVVAYALTGYKIEEKPALMGAFHFAITNSIGAFLVLTGIGLLYGRTGALNLAQVGATLAGVPADSLVLTAFTLITAGFGIKAALVPFHFWLDDAHAVAPSPVCVLFSGVMVELGLYAVVRIYWVVFSGVPGLDGAFVRDIWMGWGVLTAVVGAIMCFAQCHLKRLLAFSTISHTGVFLVGTALLNPGGLAGTALYVLGHGMVKGALFLATGILLNRFASVDEKQLHGKGRHFPGLGVLFLLAGFALAGVPPFGPYLGKSLLEEAAEASGSSWINAVLFLSSALTGGAVLRAGGGIFLGLGSVQAQGASTPRREKKETDENYRNPPLIMVAPIAALLALALTAGLWPGLAHRTNEAADRFMDREAYARLVLRGESTPRSVADDDAPTTSGIVSGLGAGIAGFVLALLALFRQRIPEGVRNVAHGMAHPALRVLRALHSGQVSDYVAWIVAGAAVLGGLVLLHP